MPGYFFMSLMLSVVPTTDNNKCNNSDKNENGEDSNDGDNCT